MEAICRDLAAEHQDLDELVRALADEAWERPTPAPGWAVRDQISHLCFFDGTAAQAVSDPDGFVRDTAALMEAVGSGVDPSVELGRTVPPAELLAQWRAGRARLLEVLGATDPRARVLWYGPAMGARSFATARLMETWAHGQDVADALGVLRMPTMRLRHVAHIGVLARPYAYLTNGRTVPANDVRVELVAPDGSTWAWGTEDAVDRVTGDALDFCLVVTQRRHPADTRLRINGPVAEEWMGIAQAFAGPPGEGREAGQFPS